MAETLVQRLRDFAKDRLFMAKESNLASEAAAEIERLTAEVERKDKALQSLIDAADGCAWAVNTSMMDESIKLARQALACKEGG